MADGPERRAQFDEMRLSARAVSRQPVFSHFNVGIAYSGPPRPVGQRAVTVFSFV
jgi:hypothetical protein